MMTGVVVLTVSVAVIVVGLLIIFWRTRKPVVARLIQHKYLDIWGSKIHYIEAGNPGGLPIVMVNGWMGGWKAFSKTMPYFEKDYRLVIVDLPGFGYSEEIEQKHTVENYSLFLKAFLEKIGLERFHLIGLSLGAALVIKFTASCPQMVEKLIIQGAPFWGELFKWWMRSGSRIITFWPVVKILDRIFDIPPIIYLVLKMQKDLGHLSEEELWEKAERIGDASARAAMESAKDIVSLDLREEAKSIECPTLLIDGADVNFPPINTSKELHKLIPNSEVKLIGGASHTVPTQKPKEFADAILEFLKK